MAGRCNASQDAQDAWNAGDASLASGRNADGSDVGSVFADDVNPETVQTMLPTIHLYGGSRTVERANSAYPQTQCKKCWKFGHVKYQCKEETPTCPFCLLNHTKAEHRCPNPSCPRGGNLKPVLNCCPAPPAKCPNCGEPHSTRSRDCSERPAPQ